MSVPSPFLISSPSLLSHHFLYQVPTLWKTATRAAVVALEDQKAYWSEKCNSLAEDAGVLDKYTAVT